MGSDIQLVFAAVVLGLLMVQWRLWVARRLDRDPQTRALLALQYELFTVVRWGRAPLEAHAADWRNSPIFSRYPTLASDDVMRTYLIDALLLLVDEVAPHDLDELLRASMRIARRHKPASRRDARRQLRLLECIRRSVVAMRRGVAPVAAVRSGRDVFSTDARPTTQDITSALIGFSTRIGLIRHDRNNNSATDQSREQAHPAVRHIDAAAARHKSKS